MVTRIFARKALLPAGWRNDVEIVIEGGAIAAVTAGIALPADAVGVLLPGLCNAHSHAFQRALAGHTEFRGPGDRDNFWSWRECMYRLAEQVDADKLCAIARQAYCEMLASGYTSVVEFHYLHSEPGQVAGDAMFDALRRAAADSGIRLTYVPVLYERGGFDNAPLSAAQQRFAQAPEDFFAHYRRARDVARGEFVVGIGAHSLRAVSTRSLDAIVATAMADEVPLHLHIAEQRREVEQCVAAHDERPVRLLLHRYPLDERWCLVHATHMDDEETAAVAASGAVVCLCPSTEANLGDGLFPLPSFLQQGGRIAIGSDSHVSLNPFEELRWLEYGQRLVAEQRNIAAVGHRNTGHGLFERVAGGGALAAGGAIGRLEKGAAADLLVLDDTDPMLVGHDAETMLDALVFSGYMLPIERVMVNGQWQVVDGNHVNRAFARSEYARVRRALAVPGSGA